MARLPLFARSRRAAVTVAVAVSLAGLPADAGASARSDYERLVARVEALRLDGPRPTPRPQLRRVVADAESLARRHGGSGYADNALWQAATVALASWRVYRQPADRTHGLQLLETLVRRYPSSSLVSDARALMRRHGPTSTPAASVARATPTPPPAPTPTPAVVPVASTAPPPLATPAVTSSAAAPSAVAPRTPGTGRVATLRGLRRTQIGDTVRLTLDFDAEVAFEQQRLAGPDRLFFDFVHTQAIATLADTVLQFEGPAVRRVRLGRPKADVTRLVIDLDGVASYSVFALYHPFRLTIDLQPAHMRPAPAPVGTVAAAPVAPPPPPAPRTGVVPGPISLPAAMAAPSAPPPLPPLRAHRVVAPAASRPSRVPSFASRPVSSQPDLLRGRRLQPSMLRAAIRVPRGPRPPFDFTVVAANADRGARRDRRVVAATPPALAPAVPVVPSAPAENGAGGFSIARQLGLGVSRIVIDPGHGGKDPGASGSKTTEAEVVLDVSLRLEKILAVEPGIEVVLTRRDDTFIPLEERTAIANRHTADLFLSIHANSSRNRKAAGVETYILNFASNADAASVAARENASAAGSMRNLPDMVKAITQGNKREESRDFADAVQASMVSKLRPHNPPLRDLGVKQAPFVVLIGAGMPSVLAEIAFISHDGEGGLLRTEKYRQRIAEALAAAILRYTRTLKPVGTVAAQN
jgi:N-acetylmuramoyl-L-alanine amidase